MQKHIKNRLGKGTIVLFSPVGFGSNYPQQPNTYLPFNGYGINPLNGGHTFTHIVVMK